MDDVAFFEQLKTYRTRMANERTVYVTAPDKQNVWAVLMIGGAAVKLPSGKSLNFALSINARDAGSLVAATDMEANIRFRLNPDHEPLLLRLAKMGVPPEAVTRGRMRADAVKAQKELVSLTLMGQVTGDEPAFTTRDRFTHLALDTYGLTVQLVEAWANYLAEVRTEQAVP